MAKDLRPADCPIKAPSAQQAGIAPRGYSSVGRAFEWHSKGQEFESPYLHHRRSRKTSGENLGFFVLSISLRRQKK